MHVSLFLSVHKKASLYYKGFTIYCRVDLSNVLPELYIEVADPELPGHKGVLSSLFSSAHQSVVDREELCEFIVCTYVGPML